MVNLVAFLQPAQNRDRVFDRRFAHINLLKTSFEGRIFFDVLLVLVQRGRPDATQLAPRQRGLQHIRSIDCPFRRSGPDQRVQLIDEKNDLALRVFYFLQHRFEAILKLAAIFCAGQHRS